MRTRARTRARVTPILQTEMSECGLACLAMIANAHGHDVDLNSLRARHHVSMHGASLKELIAVAGTLDLAARPLRLGLEDLPKLALPALLHWDLNHYVVLERVTPTHVHVVDPGRGRRRMAISEVGDHFTGVALELSPRESFRPVSDVRAARLDMLWSSLRGMKRAVVQLLVLSGVLQLCVLAMPVFLQVTVDGVIPRGDGALLLALALGFGGLAAIRAVAEAVRGWAVLVYGNRMSEQMTGNVFRHLIRLPVSYFERRHVGDLVSRMGSTTPIQTALTQSVVGVVIDGVMAVVMLGVMFVYSVQLALVVVATTLVAIAVTLWVYPRLRQAREDGIHARASEQTHVIESIRASTPIKLFGREAAREAQWSNLYADFVERDIRYGGWLLVRNFARTAVGGVQTVAVVWLGATLVMGGEFSLGMLFAFLAFRQSFATAVFALIEKGVELGLLSVHLDRLSDIAHSEKEVLDSGTGLEEIAGHIRLDGVSFRYGEGDPWVVQDLDLNIRAGEMVTLTGLSGGGKTTLLKLMMGLYAPTEGRVLVDGRPLDDIGIREWRSAIGVVMQDDVLLSGTIADNISFFDPEADMARVVEAARAARVHDDIARIPMNYLAPVGNMGSVLSGGQRQRVLLARALYARPRVLFLDEGTANLDRDTEAHIVETVAAMEITRVIVAHRPAFLKASDRVVELRRGKVVETATANPHN